MKSSATRWFASSTSLSARECIRGTTAPSTRDRGLRCRFRFRLDVILLRAQAGHATQSPKSLDWSTCFRPLNGAAASNNFSNEASERWPKRSCNGSLESKDLVRDKSAKWRAIVGPGGSDLPPIGGPAGIDGLPYLNCRAEDSPVRMSKSSAASAVTVNPRPSSAANS